MLIQNTDDVITPFGVLLVFMMGWNLIVCLALKFCGIVTLVTISATSASSMDMSRFLILMQ